MRSPVRRSSRGMAGRRGPRACLAAAGPRGWPELRAAWRILRLLHPFRRHPGRALMGMPSHRSCSCDPNPIPNTLNLTLTLTLTFTLTLTLWTRPRTAPSAASCSRARCGGRPQRWAAHCAARWPQAPRSGCCAAAAGACRQNHRGPRTISHASFNAVGGWWWEGVGLW